jgi:ferredoxin
VPEAAAAERLANREKVLQALKKQEPKLAVGIRDAVDESQDSDIYDAESQKCIECQACTRVCPTCHCFYLHDDKQEEYFTKTKIWDSCMRLNYARVAGDTNPRKILGDRMRHRMLHKFVYFLDRYGINMCVGCGRCIDADAGGMDIRLILKKLSEGVKGKSGKAGAVK